MSTLYEPIKRKLSSWIEYALNMPTSKYSEDPTTHDRYRAINDTDCVLCGGDLRADTIFSLWIPLRFALVRLNGYDKIEKITGCHLQKSPGFLEQVCLDEHIRLLLPDSNNTVHLLSTLFEYGQTRANVMILPERWMQKRGKPPYYDYMPYFLHECFHDGDFSSPFLSDDDLRAWIQKESLYFFFGGTIECKNILDLAGTGDVKKGNPSDLDYLLQNYIDILEKRTSVIDSAKE